jgi:tRNA G18 (ribose-2'-O)-methylase SpoU
MSDAATNIRSYLLLFNVSKKQNLGNLIRTANALGCAEVLVVGRRAYREFGAFETAKTTKTRHFYSLEDACDHLRGLGCSICGVEIADGAVAIDAHPFTRSTAFMVGNEGTGLNAKQLAYCDQLVYVPQFGTGGSLNVNVAAAIVLHNFANWAKFSETERKGSKFVGDDNVR